jgi:hypothetical protein
VLNNVHKKKTIKILHDAPTVLEHKSPFSLNGIFIFGPYKKVFLILAPIRSPRLGRVILSSFSCFSLPRQRGFGEAGARRVQPRGSLQQAAHVLQNPGPRHRSRDQRNQLLVSLKFSLHLILIYLLFS